jgi:ribosome modulation factor
MKVDGRMVTAIAAVAGVKRRSARIFFGIVGGDLTSRSIARLRRAQELYAERIRIEVEEEKGRASRLRDEHWLTCPYKDGLLREAWLSGWQGRTIGPARD